MDVAELKWLIPLGVGAIAFLLLIAGLLRGAPAWPVVALAVLSASLIGAVVWARVEFTKAGLIVETASAAVKAAEIVDELSVSVRRNTDAIAKLNEQFGRFVSSQNSGGIVAPQSFPYKQFNSDLDSIKNLNIDNLKNLDQINNSNEILKNNIESIKKSLGQ